MFVKLARSLIAFGVVFVAYQVYALAVVPLLEPTRVTRSASQGGLINPARNPVEKSQQVLASYFPLDHWSLKGRPIVIESGQVMLVLDDFQRDDRGRVDLTRCVVLIFPTMRQQGGQPPRDAVIIEAPQGAKLLFDQDFNPSRGRIGKIVQGLFPGRIVVRSDMRQPGPEDDLLIETSDLQISESLVFTHEDVTFRAAHGDRAARGRAPAARRGRLWHQRRETPGNLR
jgi:hypothetical protein